MAVGHDAAHLDDADVVARLDRHRRPQPRGRRRPRAGPARPPPGRDAGRHHRPAPHDLGGRHPRQDDDVVDAGRGPRRGRPGPVLHHRRRRAPDRHGRGVVRRRLVRGRGRRERRHVRRAHDRGGRGHQRRAGPPRPLRRLRPRCATPSTSSSRAPPARRGRRRRRGGRGPGRAPSRGRDGRRGRGRRLPDRRPAAASRWAPRSACERGGDDLGRDPPARARRPQRPQRRRGRRHRPGGRRILRRRRRRRWPASAAWPAASSSGARPPASPSSTTTPTCRPRSPPPSPPVGTPTRIAWSPCSSPTATRRLRALAPEFGAVVRGRRPAGGHRRLQRRRDAHPRRLGQGRGRRGAGRRPGRARSRTCPAGRTSWPTSSAACGPATSA